MKLIDATQIISKIKENNLNHTKFSELVSQMSVILNLSVPETQEQLNSLVSNGDIMVGGNGTIALRQDTNILKGKVMTTGAGITFFRPENATDKSEDILISTGKTNSALNGDIALVKVTKNDAVRKEGEIISVISRAPAFFKGKIYVTKRFAYFTPFDSKLKSDIIIPLSEAKGIRNGTKVIVELTNFKETKYEGKVVEVLEEENSTEFDISYIKKQYSIPEGWPDEVIAEAEKIPNVVLPEEWENRDDLTNENLVTIDGDDARDFDDAVSFKKLPNGNTEIIVAIADVSNYVKPGTAIFDEAFKRATSTYFPNCVVPMLPEKLSNGICSLNHNVERLVEYVKIEVDSNMKVINKKIGKGVMKSKHRMTYNEVQKIIDGDAEMREKYSDVLDSILLGFDGSTKLNNIREKRGAINFKSTEPYIVMNKDNTEIVEIKKREQRDSEKLIESYMILANEVVASEFNQLGLPFVYRVHEEPEEERVIALIEYLKGLGVKTPVIKDGEGVKPMVFQKILKEIEGKPYEEAVNMVMLKTMQKAKYDTHCLGHYGLASTDYCHFTSPIRRLADTLIHQIIKEKVNNTLTPEKIEDYKLLFARGAEQASQQEVTSEKAERDVDDYFKGKYMAKFIGNEFSGRISGITDFGIFVELDNSCEGLIKMDNLPFDTYKADKSRFHLVGLTHKFTLGDEIKVKIEKVSHEGKVEMVTAGRENEITNREVAKKNENAQGTQEIKEQVQKNKGKPKKSLKQRKLEMYDKFNGLSK